jgi:TRAP-type C4-dicarboxylate transport system permease small subunit
MVPCYACVALIIVGEAIRRYLVGVQTQWGSTVSIYVFIGMSWLGCAYHVRTRGHLRFDGIRRRLPLALRHWCYLVDDVLWLVLAVIVIYATLDLVRVQVRLGSMLEGTETIPLWVATAAVPFGWALISLRAVQDIVLLILGHRRAEAPELPGFEFVVGERPPPAEAPTGQPALFPARPPGPSA